MRYSNEILNDNNFDLEVEKLAEKVGIPHYNYNSFVEKLDEGFEKQLHELGFEEWINCSTVPRNANGLEASQLGQVAYEFNNGFVIMDFEVLL